ncbi:O-antigen ligase family protein [Sphingomonas phyllosphaerae]|uniref:O-antigen ligase family protein n=1 Tax=Sphingomonas phyllosphaerae TaxID=257003 RepID=UPI0003B4D448|nr:O-antigen ligase family protein [Sphingomonas phyllosphaerae]
MPTRHRPLPFPLPGIAFALLLALLAMLWLAGGASRADVSGQVVVRVAAWGALIVAGLLAPRPNVTRDLRPVAWLLAFGVVLVALQLIPLPADLWLRLPGRAVLTEAVPRGAPQPWRPWTMTPGATGNALSALVVPVAVLVLLVAMRPAERALLPGVLLVMVTIAMLVGLLQVSGARLSNPFVNDTVGQVSGIFANRNHFAVFLACGCLLAPAWAFRGERHARWRGPLALGLIVLFVMTILATGSRAGMLTAVLAVLIALTMVRHELRRQLSRAPRWAFLALIASVLGLLAVVVAASVAANRAESIHRTFAVDVGTDMRNRGLPIVLKMISTYLPLGSGVGGFDPMFRMHEPLALLKPTFFNHAHNDFLEVVLDAGVPGGLLLGAALFWWLSASIRVWRVRGGAITGAGRLGSAILLLLIVASAFDYPLRTPTMMALTVIAAVWLADGQGSGDEAGKRSSLPEAGQHL